MYLRLRGGWSQESTNPHGYKWFLPSLHLIHLFLHPSKYLPILCKIFPLHPISMIIADHLGEFSKLKMFLSELTKMGQWFWPKIINFASFPFHFASICFSFGHFYPNSKIPNSNFSTNQPINQTDQKTRPWNRCSLKIKKLIFLLQYSFWFNNSSRNIIFWRHFSSFTSSWSNLHKICGRWSEGLWRWE